MSLNLGQNKVIEKLNHYLKWNNLPVRMNEEGICNGLASVYAKYVLEGKEIKFLEILNHIVNMDQDPILKDEINLFVYEVVLTLFTEQFDKKLSQANSIRALTINNKPLKSSFDFAITTSDNHWVAIFKELNLQENEVMRILGTAHTVSVRRKGTHYIIYDPNYDSAVKEFATEQELITELHYNVFGYHNGYYLYGGPLGMMINVIRHPEHKQSRVFPDKIKMYEQYLTNETVNNKAVSLMGGEFRTLEKAAILLDSQAVNKLIAKGAIDYEHQAAANAVMHNNPQVLSALLQQNRDTALFQQLFTLALEHGREEAYEQLLLMKGALPMYSNTAIRCAAKGGNPDLLAKVMRYFLDSHAGLSDLQAAVLPAIQSGSLKCVRLIVEQLHRYKSPSDTESNMTFLLESIRMNNLAMVAFFIKKIPSACLQTLNLSVSVVDKTDLNLLLLLQKKGVVFSEIAKAVIAKKEHRSIGLYQILGIMLNKFTDFCNELLFNDSGITIRKPVASVMRGRFFERRPDAIPSLRIPTANLNPG